MSVSTDIRPNIEYANHGGQSLKATLYAPKPARW